MGPAFCRYGNFVALSLLSLYFLIIPACMMVTFLADANLRDGGIPAIASWSHRSLSPKVAQWAQWRIQQGLAQELTVSDIAETEWPLFGSVFYLWATEALQDAWEKSHVRTSPAPKVYAADAIEAATALVVDPGHASWVIDHWGKDYLRRENVFYRMLLISALTSYQRLLGSYQYAHILREQVDSLSEELDRSPHGLLDDYPGECYPSDVVAAIAAIQRADAVLGTDHSAFIKRSVRAFKGKLVDPTGLPPYSADANTGTPGEARGCSSQWVTVWTPRLWPDHGARLYNNFTRHFWQQSWAAAGFREFPKGDTGREWYFDVDAGPVMGGLGTAATAFGIGAARANGRFDHAYAMTAEAIVLSWPWPNGTLAGPRILSNMAHAPYLGESALLFAMTRTPPQGTTLITGGRIPALVYAVLAACFGAGMCFMALAVFSLRRWKKTRAERTVPLAKWQSRVWLVLIATGLMAWMMYSLALGLVLILSGQLLPRSRPIR